MSFTNKIVCSVAVGSMSWPSQLRTLLIKHWCRQAQAVGTDCRTASAWDVANWRFQFFVYSNLANTPQHLPPSSMSFDLLDNATSTFPSPLSTTHFQSAQEKAKRYLKQNQRYRYLVLAQALSQAIIPGGISEQQSNSIKRFLIN